MTLPPDLANLEGRMSAAVRQHWKAFLIEGIVLVILGVAAKILPPVASLAVTLLLGLTGGIIIAGSPRSALWAIGVLVGINMLFGGATLIGMALAARNSAL